MFKATELVSAEVEFKPKEPDLPMGTFNQVVPLAGKGWREQETWWSNPNGRRTGCQHHAKYLPIPSAQGTP